MDTEIGYKLLKQETRTRNGNEIWIWIVNPEEETRTDWTRKLGQE